MVHTIDNKSLCAILFHYFQDLKTVLLMLPASKRIYPHGSRIISWGFLKVVSNLSFAPSVGIFLVLRKLR